MTFAFARFANKQRGIQQFSDRRHCMDAGLFVRFLCMPERISRTKSSEKLWRYRIAQRMPHPAFLTLRPFRVLNGRDFFHRCPDTPMQCLPPPATSTIPPNLSVTFIRAIPKPKRKSLPTRLEPVERFTGYDHTTSLVTAMPTKRKHAFVQSGRPDLVNVIRDDCRFGRGHLFACLERKNLWPERTGLTFQQRLE